MRASNSTLTADERDQSALDDAGVATDGLCWTDDDAGGDLRALADPGVVTNRCVPDSTYAPRLTSAVGWTSAPTATKPRPFACRRYFVVVPSSRSISSNVLMVVPPTGVREIADKRLNRTYLDGIPRR